MKKLLIILFLLILPPTKVWALTPPNTNAVSSQVVTKGINNSSYDQAEMLKKLGLFFGTESSFELERGLNRAEAAVMLVRFLGEEKAVVSARHKHPFTDVPEWAADYIGWLYENGLASGISAAKYGSGQNVTYRQFAESLSRTCSGSDDYLNTGFGNISEQELSEGNNMFLRGDAVSLLTRALQCPYTSNSYEGATAQYLVQKEAFSAEQWFDAAVKVFPIYYGYSSDRRLTASIAGVLARESIVSGVSGHTADDMAELPYFYAWVNDEAGMTLFKMDCLTLTETLLEQYSYDNAAGNRRIVKYIGSTGGVDYLEIILDGRSALVCVDGGTVSTLAENLNTEASFTSDDTLIISATGELYVMNGKNSEIYALDEGKKVVGFGEGTAVIFSENEINAVVEGLDVTNLLITDSFEVPRSDETHPQIWYSATGNYGEPGWCGEAGWYIIREGRLVQLTERPVLAVSGLRYGAMGVPIFLSHEHGDPHTGSIIVRAENNWLEEYGAETVLLGNDPPHEINIDSIGGVDSAVFFNSIADDGSGGYNKYTYLCLYSDSSGRPTIFVYGFEAGRPEALIEHDEEWYVEKEQTRINALGYGFSE